MQLLVKQPDPANWSGPILFDSPFRDLLTNSTRQGRDDASAISNIFWYASMAYPLVDTLISALAVHQDPEAAWEMFAMTAQSFAATGFVSALFVSTIGRGRPMNDRCLDDPDYSSLCHGVEANRSFASGHASFAFTGAGLTCAFHSEMELYGDGPWGTVACIGTLATATTTGVLRMVADRHWISDVLVGGGIGFAAGYLLPKLLHFDYNDDGPNVVMTPWSNGDALGLGLSGTL
ncbi:MAG: membrane-associated phospholipid phosphatase [Myxococcota bacterium]|jgi:membrane-associated phospholipid phosphatase